MKLCKEPAPPWSKEWHCSSKGWLFGYCFHHWIWKLRWEWRLGRFVTIRLDASNLNLPRIYIDSDRPIKYITFEIQSDGCDPVFQVAIDWSRYADESAKLQDQSANREG